MDVLRLHRDQPVRDDVRGLWARSLRHVYVSDDHRVHHESRALDAAETREVSRILARSGAQLGLAGAALVFVSLFLWAGPPMTTFPFLAAALDRGRAHE